MIGEDAQKYVDPTGRALNAGISHRIGLLDHNYKNTTTSSIFCTSNEEAYQQLRNNLGSIYHVAPIVLLNMNYFSSKSACEFPQTLHRDAVIWLHPGDESGYDPNH